MATVDLPPGPAAQMAHVSRPPRAGRSTGRLSSPSRPRCSAGGLPRRPGGALPPSSENWRGVARSTSAAPPSRVCKPMSALDLTLGGVAVFSAGVAVATWLGHREAMRVARHSIDVCARAQEDFKLVYEHTHRELSIASKQAQRYHNTLHEIEKRARAGSYSTATDADEELAQLAKMAR